jgi:hypothetical protein
MHSLIPFVRSHSPDTRIGSWSVAAAGAYTRAIFPASLGGFAERLLVLPPPGGTESTPPIPIALTGEIHRIPGIPPFYDYEAYPQDHAVPAALMPMMGLMTRYAEIGILALPLTGNITALSGRLISPSQHSGQNMSLKLLDPSQNGIEREERVLTTWDLSWRPSLDPPNSRRPPWRQKFLSHQGHWV